MHRGLGNVKGGGELLWTLPKGLKELSKSFRESALKEMEEEAEVEPHEMRELSSHEWRSNNDSFCYLIISTISESFRHKDEQEWDVLFSYETSKASIFRQG
eukprot:TRINITY_DN1365_c0_g1_i5.p1 TRINITY_DN1365_c0_g1~~TRINITY_DN1365_c0_g1_i5.p1  ORF type:complete len:101 (-),score=16.25 TRINITY_DN1365_c0_g1_i5:252-554(-)